MKKHLIFLFISIVLLQSCTTSNYLQKSESLLLTSSSSGFLTATFKEKYNVLGHNFEPWETTKYTGNGTFWLNNTTFLKQDTLINSRGNKYTSKTEYTDGALLYLDYGDTSLLPLTTDLYFEKIIHTARYSPAIVLGFFINNKSEVTIEKTNNLAVYSMKMGDYLVELYINTETNLVDKITYHSYDEMYGDVTTAFVYSAYITTAAYAYPSSILIEKINGKVIDNVEITDISLDAGDFSLLEKPDNYSFVEEKTAEKAEIKVTKYNDYIHFIDLFHTDDKVMVVEFDDYMLVAEAPLNSANGELIITEIKKIAPSKPIKYFAFGHHHPHYLGGLRAFVHKGATILCTEVSEDYVAYIANASHSLKPDSLQLEPKKLKTQIVSDSLVLGKNNALIIYSIGKKSSHTKDYLLYYFPNDRLLFQDDLCWIPSEGAPRKAGPRQVGLYNAMKDLKIEVDTIIQSWPVSEHKVKTVFPYSDLEKSILIEN